MEAIPQVRIRDVKRITSPQEGGRDVYEGAFEMDVISDETPIFLQTLEAFPQALVARNQLAKKHDLQRASLEVTVDLITAAMNFTYAPDGHPVVVEICNGGLRLNSATVSPSWVDLPAFTAFPLETAPFAFRIDGKILRLLARLARQGERRISDSRRPASPGSAAGAWLCFHCAPNGRYLTYFGGRDENVDREIHYPIEPCEPQNLPAFDDDQEGVPFPAGQIAKATALTSGFCNLKGRSDRPSVFLSSGKIFCDTDPLLVVETSASTSLKFRVTPPAIDGVVKQLRCLTGNVLANTNDEFLIVSSKGRYICIPQDGVPSHSRGNFDTVASTSFELDQNELWKCATYAKTIDAHGPLELSIKDHDLKALGHSKNAVRNSTRDFFQHRMAIANLNAGPEGRVRRAQPDAEQIARLAEIVEVGPTYNQARIEFVSFDDDTDDASFVRVIWNADDLRCKALLAKRRSEPSLV